MANLTPAQRGQVRRDLLDLGQANLKLQKNSFAPDWAKEAGAVQLRLLETLAIAQGAFLPDEVA